MRLIELLSLKAGNFQGQKHFAQSFDGKSATIIGFNGAGKSTVATIFFWLFIGTDVNGKAAADLAKPLDENMQPIHNLETWVEAEMRVDGKRHTFKRLFKEDWVTKIGSAVAKMDGHSNSYWVDGVKMGTETEFKTQLSKLFGELDIFPCLTNPAWFLSDKMAVKGKSAEARRREVLLEMCGDVTEQSVIDANPELEPLKNRDDRTVDMWLKIQSEQLSEGTKELNQIPKLINELQSNLQEVEGQESHHREATESLQTQLREAYERRAQISSGGEIARLQVSISGVETSIAKRTSFLASQTNPERDSALAAKRTYADQIADVQSHRRRKEMALTDLKAELERLTRERAKKLSQVTSLKTQIDGFASERFAGATSCPGCGQDLPPERIEAATAKFNADIASRRERAQIDFDAIVVAGKALRGRMDELSGKDGLAGMIGVAEGEIRDLDVEIDRIADLAVTVVVPDAVTVDPTQDHEILKLAGEKASFEKELTAARASSEQILIKVGKDIAFLESEIGFHNVALGKIEANKHSKARIASHEARKDELAEILEEHAFQVHLCKQFVMAHVHAVESRINDRFRFIRWKLFNVQVNEGINPCCLPTIKGSSNLSTGERILAGLDICEFFQNFHQTSCPVWVDNAEGYTGSFEAGSQMIRLVADRTLVPKSLQITLYDSKPAEISPSIASQPERELASALF